MNSQIFCICLVGLCYLRNVEPLKITRLDVPKSAWDSVKLNCKYELEGDDKLYAVKWYKDNQEFFRCFADGTIQEFPLREVRIYHTETAQLGSCFFELTALTTKSGGDYMCEVSLDWPTFNIAQKTSRLQIIEPSKIVQDRPTEKNDIETLTSPVLEKGDIEDPAEEVFNSGSIRFLPSIVKTFIIVFVIYMYL